MTMSGITIPQWLFAGAIVLTIVTAILAGWTYKRRKGDTYKLYLCVTIFSAFVTLTAFCASFVSACASLSPTLPH